MKIIIFFSLLILLISCKHHLTEKAKEWNPYEAGDVLVFESNDKQLDTVLISETEQYFTGESEILKVYTGLLSNDTESKIETNNSHNFFLALTAWENKETVLSLNLYTANSKFFPFTVKTITWLDSLPTKSIFGFEKVLTLVPDSSSTDVNIDQSDSALVNKVYWSKSRGLIGYALKNNGRVWLLKEKYSL